MKIFSSIDKKIYRLKDYNFYRLCLLLVVFFYSLISYENITFSLYFNNIYKEYGAFFWKLDWSVFSNPKITFPMWGYGIVHFLKLSELTTLIFQQLFTIYALLRLDKILTKYNLITNIQFFRLLILLSSTWFLFHTQMWPKSISANLLLIGSLFIIEFLKSKKEIFLLYTGITFGILHNFRPDYFYLSIILYLIFLYYSRVELNWKKLSFPLIQYILLIPWMLFTYHQTDRILPTSTNGGHVLFIGLGQLPDNKWGITPVDEDPIKRKILNENFGPIFKSDNYKEDKYLKKKFFEYISNDPFEFFKKCLFSLRLLVLDPFYVGNVGNFQRSGISNIHEIRQLENLIYNFRFIDSYTLISETNWKFTKKEIFQLVITIYTKIFSVLFFIVFLFISLSCLKIFNFNKFPNPIYFYLSLILVYQISISLFAFHMPVYNTISYIFYVLLTYLLFQKYLSIRQ